MSPSNSASGRSESFQSVQKSTGAHRNTDRLMEILENTAQLPPILEELAEEFNAPSFCEQLSAYMDRQQLNAARLSELALMSRSFTYQICNGERQPSRDIVLRLALVLGLSVEETQRLLRLAQKGVLYPRIRRDAILIFALKDGIDLLATNELLIAHGEMPLVS